MKSLYKAAEIALLRVPSLPCDGVWRAPGGSDEVVMSLASRPDVAEALRVASSAVAELLDRDPADLTERQRKRLWRTVTRYVVRMSTRPTPFGLFAGVGLVRFGSDVHAVLGKEHRKVLRPDMSWLRRLTVSLEQQPQVLPAVRVALNNLCFRRGERLVLPYLPGVGVAETDAETRGKELSLRVTETVEMVLASLTTPMLVARLEALVRREIPTISENDVRELVLVLVGRGVLLTDLHPDLSSGDPLAHVLRRVSDAEMAEVGALKECQKNLDSYSRSRIGKGADSWARAVEKLNSLQEADHVIQVDMALDADVCLPRAVVREAERTATALWRASVKVEPYGLREYRQQFLERYGSDRLVAVRELLDPDVGMGVPTGHSSDVQRDDAVRSRVLGRLVGDALASGEHEIVLDDGVIEHLYEAGPLESCSAPPALDVYATVLAPSVDALNGGNFSLVFNGSSWGRVAGATMGRFSHVLPDATVGLDDLARRLGQVLPNPVDLSWRVREPRNENVARVPSRYRFRVAVGHFTDGTDREIIDLDDIVVGADAQGFRLFSRSLDQEISPVVGHQLTLYGAPPLARFLAQATWSRVRGQSEWSWGAFDALPFLPRVRYGKSIVSCARWRLNSELCRAGDRDPDEWLEAFDQWRASQGVPDVVAVGHADQMLSLDLRVSSQRAVLRDEIVRGRHDTLHEVPGNLDAAAHGWLARDGGSYVGQVVIPMTLSKPPSQSTDQKDRRLRTASYGTHPHVPGGEWLYAKIYGSSARHTDLLTHHLPDLLAAADEHITRWFFIRYADPEPHLRIRFHGEPSRLNYALLPLLHNWMNDLHRAGLAHRLVLDTYVPETERYGDLSTLSLAEDVFHTDSVAVLHQLTTMNDTPADTIAAAHCIDLTRSAHHPVDWEPWVLNTWPRSHPGLDWGKAYSALTDLLACDPPGPGPSIRRHTQLANAWAQRSAAIARYAERLRHTTDSSQDRLLWAHHLESVLHMHCNRMLGSRHLETRAYAIARKWVQTQLACTTAGQEAQQK